MFVCLFVVRRISARVGRKVTRAQSGVEGKGGRFREKKDDLLATQWSRRASLASEQVLQKGLYSKWFTNRGSRY